MSRASQPNTPLPIPAAPSPVQPPKARSTWWVYVLMLFFLILTAVAVFTVKWRRTLEEGIEVVAGSPSQSEFISQDDAEEEKIYSYLSVVTATSQIDYYQGTEEECVSTEVGEAPTTIAEPIYFIVRVTVGDEASRLARFIALMNEHEIPVTIGVTDEPPLELAAWVEQGHEAALHIDEAVLFGDVATPLAYGTWLSALHDFRDEIETACACDVTTLSGGEWYGRIFAIASELGFKTAVDWQDELGRVPELLAVTNPWTPAASDSVEGLTEFDPTGPVVYLPAGFYPAQCPGSLVGQPLTPQTLSSITHALYKSLEVSVDEKINVFQVSFDSAAFAQAEDDEAEFEALETWLTEVIDPLVSVRFLRPSTVSEAATAYTTWVDRVAGTITPVYLEER